MLKSLAFCTGFSADNVRFDYSSVLVITTFLYQVRISNMYIPWSSSLVFTYTLE